MTEKTQLTGLCINCLSADDCGYRINQTKPIIFCEEFSYEDCGDQANHAKSINSLNKSSCSDTLGLENNIIRVSPQVLNSDKSIPKGICCNCENYKTCTLKKTESVVINCEEYR